jgi:hypothetical protein
MARQATQGKDLSSRRRRPSRAFDDGREFMPGVQQGAASNVDEVDEVARTACNLPQVPSARRRAERYSTATATG